MKKTLYLLFAVTVLSSCSNFLDTENLTEKNSSNFPATVEDIETALVSVYAANTEVLVNTEKYQIIQLVSELMADYTLSGGGMGDLQARAMAEFKQNGVNMYSGAWQRYYRGIHRANFILENIDRVRFDSDIEKNNILGQTYFLRAQFYFDLARMFEKVPLVLTTSPENKPQAEPDELYAQIFSDLKLAINLLPNVTFQEMSKDDLGRVTKWAAEAMLGRAYLFYSCFYKKENIRLNDGSDLNKQNVIEYIDDCIANSGHDLIEDFRELWPYSYSNKEYEYAKGLEWIGEDGKNCETVYAFKFSTMGSAGNLSYCNNINLYYGIRGQETMPFAKGWGWGSVVPKFYKEWPDDDLRKKATILNVNDPNEGISSIYKWNANRNYNETGFYNKKYIPINVRDAQGKLVNYSCELYGVTPNFQYNNTQDMVIIRFSDVLLMGAELGSSKAQDYMDRVRGRVNLPSVPPTLENIKKERLYELAFEGIRFYDLMRWGEIETAVNYMQKDVPVKTMGVDDYVTNMFRKESRGFLPIPEDQIQLSNGVLKQNPGWGIADAIYKD